MIEKVSGRVPPAAAMQQQLTLVRAMMPMAPMAVRATVGPLLEIFAAYIAATEARLAQLEDDTEDLAEDASLCRVHSGRAK